MTSRRASLARAASVLVALAVLSGPAAALPGSQLDVDEVVRAASYGFTEAEILARLAGTPGLGRELRPDELASLEGAGLSDKVAQSLRGTPRPLDTSDLLTVVQGGSLVDLWFQLPGSFRHSDGYMGNWSSLYHQPRTGRAYDDKARWIVRRIALDTCYRPRAEMLADICDTWGLDRKTRFEAWKGVEVSGFRAESRTKDHVRVLYAIDQTQTSLSRWVLLCAETTPEREADELPELESAIRGARSSYRVAVHDLVAAHAARGTPEPKIVAVLRALPKLTLEEADHEAFDRLKLGPAVAAAIRLAPPSPDAPSAATRAQPLVVEAPSGLYRASLPTGWSLDAALPRGAGIDRVSIHEVAWPSFYMGIQVSVDPREADRDRVGVLVRSIEPSAAVVPTPAGEPEKLATSPIRGTRDARRFALRSKHGTRVFEALVARGRAVHVAVFFGGTPEGVAAFGPAAREVLASLDLDEAGVAPSALALRGEWVESPAAPGGQVLTLLGKGTLARRRVPPSEPAAAIEPGLVPNVRLDGERGSFALRVPSGWTRYQADLSGFWIHFKPDMKSGATGLTTTEWYKSTYPTADGMLGRLRDTGSPPAGAKLAPFKGVELSGWSWKGPGKNGPEWVWLLETKDKWLGLVAWTSRERSDKDGPAIEAIGRTARTSEREAVVALLEDLGRARVPSELALRALSGIRSRFTFSEAELARLVEADVAPELVDSVKRALPIDPSEATPRERTLDGAGRWRANERELWLALPDGSTHHVTGEALAAAHARGELELGSRKFVRAGARPGGGASGALSVADLVLLHETGFAEEEIRAKLALSGFAGSLAPEDEKRLTALGYSEETIALCRPSGPLAAPARLLVPAGGLYRLRLPWAYSAVPEGDLAAGDSVYGPGVEASSPGKPARSFARIRARLATTEPALAAEALEADLRAIDKDAKRAAEPESIPRAGSSAPALLVRLRGAGGDLVALGVLDRGVSVRLVVAGPAEAVARALPPLREALLGLTVVAPDADARFVAALPGTWHASSFSQSSAGNTSFSFSSSYRLTLAANGTYRYSVLSSAHYSAANTPGDPTLKDTVDSYLDDPDSEVGSFVVSGRTVLLRDRKSGKAMPFVIDKGSDPVTGSVIANGQLYKK